LTAYIIFLICNVGIGTGENFRHFPLNSNLTILDKTDKFLKYIKDSIRNQKRDDLNVSKLIVSEGENMNAIESNSMDVVVHTFILCSVNDYNLVLKEIYRVLKPGGLAIFMEHSIDNDHLSRRIIQKIIEPLLGDCHYRDIRKIVNSGVYDKLTIKNYHMNSKLFDFVNPIIYGYGQKFN
jgi:ubiquinone/menaquinone biosynthesis C-methylase UbiE